MAGKSVAEKGRIKPGTTIAVLGEAQGIVGTLGLPDDVRFVDAPDAHLLFLFVATRAELEARMPPAVETLRPGAAIWVFFRKGSRAAGLDMSRNDVWAVAEGLGLRPLGLVAVDETWSAFRLRPGP